MDPTVGGGLIFGGIVLLWLIQQDRRTIFSLIVVAAIACVVAMLPDQPEHAGSARVSTVVQR